MSTELLFEVERLDRGEYRLRLIQHARFWVGPELYRAILAEFGEA